MVSLSTSLRLDPSPSSFSSPLAPRSPNLQSFSPQLMSPDSKPKPFLSSPIKLPETPLQSNGLLTPRLFEFADTMPFHRRTDPRIPQRRTRNLNPLLKSTQVRQDERRQRYLNGVRAKREEGMWEVRDDQRHRRDYLSEQRAWEAARSHEADDVMRRHVDNLYEEEEWSSYEFARHGQQSDAAVSSHNHRRPSSITKTSSASCGCADPNLNEADALEKFEQDEMEALIALHDQDEVTSPTYGSDEDGWDEVMLELVDTGHGTRDDMDMS